MSSITVHTAAQNKQLSVLKALLADNSGLLNTVDADERTPLHWAAWSGSVDIVRFLVDQKAEIDKTDNSGWTALHIAASAGNLEVVQELIGAGADVNSKNDKGLTPL
ncbi:prosome, macropain 26S subunit, non-ATPase, 10, isoform CRA_c [Coprinopsis sp. MPI-PUGE-AT-0042]|nr:prosome, macropain 26S subunit, non-ATPase, 10, isoform CRA_c [Coprinopsis sp. MPI-PUGE-AT-0042]